LLTEATKKPHCAASLTIEKGAPGHLQRVAGHDHGTLTDNNGKVDFRNVIIVMTTHAGADDEQGHDWFSPTREAGDEMAAN
jgi:ATP-dependent Clp protease ATP-binding subunit ClpA